MKRAVWTLACLACGAALMATGCQPTATGGGADGAAAPVAGQPVAGQPVVATGLKTTVLHAKGMH